ncbi:olfactory receptor 287-like protein [Camelus ferus]|nr:olfactory receptor 287-like protein [Camelus ferus]
MVWGRSQNLSTQGQFVLLGFPGPRGLQVGLFLLFLVMYALTVAGNLAIITLVRAHRHLQTPMYFFLCNLSFLEIWFTTACVPKTLATFASQSGAISFAGCVAQMYFVFSLGCTEYFLLAAMAYDRYLAICLPLRYGSIMTPSLSLPLCYGSIMTPSLSAHLALGSWLCGFSAITIVLSCSDRRPVELASFGIAFCVILGSCFITLVSYAYIIVTIVGIPSAQGRGRAFSTCSSHLTVVLIWYGSTVFLHIVLSCSDRRPVELASFGIAFCVILGSCFITLVSYAYIIVTIVGIPSAQGRGRAFSTCSSHLTVVLIWYGSTVFLHVRTSVESSLDLTKAITVLNTIITLVLNPFIYTLRNKDVKEALRRSSANRLLSNQKMYRVGPQSRRELSNLTAVEEPCSSPAAVTST